MHTSGRNPVTRIAEGSLRGDRDVRCGVGGGDQVRGYANPSKIDLGSDVTLQKARTWDEGVETNFSTSSMADIFAGKKVVIFGLPGAFTGVCTRSHVPSFASNAEHFRSKGVDSIICVSLNDPYVMKGWGTSLGCSDKIAFYGDFNGAFTAMMGLDCDLSGALMGPRCQRWSALVENGEIKSLNVEETPAQFVVSSGDYLLKKM